MNVEYVIRSGGYHVTSYVLRKTGVTLDSSKQNSLNLAGTNMLGEKPKIPRNRGLIDPDTPAEVRCHHSVFSYSGLSIELGEDADVFHAPEINTIRARVQ